MATYNSNEYANPAVALAGGFDITVPFSLATTDFATDHKLLLNDVINLRKIPKGATILDWYLYMPDVESSTGAFTFDLGLDSGAEFLDDSQVGRAVGLATPNNNPNGLVANALPAAELTADKVLTIKCTAAATAAGDGGTIKGWVKYILRGSTAF